jgi:PilZ domain
MSNQQPSRQRSGPRVKVSVPVELRIPGNDIPHRGATSDLSESGCYIETMFPFPIGTIFEMTLQLEETLLAMGTVVTCHIQVGNGIMFTKMLPEDQEELRAFVEAAQKTDSV